MAEAECDDDESRFNVGEASVVVAHVKRKITMLLSFIVSHYIFWFLGLIESGVAQQQIGVLSPYNGQVRILKELLLKQFPRLEIGSVDGTRILKTMQYY
jgi:hypothetical protein